MAKVTLDGFESIEQANLFVNWYQNQGEQCEGMSCMGFSAYSRECEYIKESETWIIKVDGKTLGEDD